MFHKIILQDMSHLRTPIMGRVDLGLRKSPTGIGYKAGKTNQGACSHFHYFLGLQNCPPQASCGLLPARALQSLVTQYNHLPRTCSCLGEERESKQSAGARSPLSWGRALPSNAYFMSWAKRCHITSALTFPTFNS